MTDLSTEAALRDWRTGSIQAERLAAAILRLEKFQNIEPQAPLGGGDNGADILCDRGSRRWVGAVYFPPTVQDFKDIEKKFKSDVKSAKNRRRQGIVFITNQRLTRSERQNLTALAFGAGQECLVYDVERIRGVLDSPEGYGVRIAYLRITMSAEEQVAFFASRENVLEEALSKNAEHMKAIAVQLEMVRAGQKHVAHTVDALALAQNITVEPPRGLDPLAVGEITAATNDVPVLSQLTPATLRFVHRLVCFDMPPRMIGQFRKEQIYIQKASAAPSAPTISPSAPAEIPALVEQLCQRWRQHVSGAASVDAKLQAIAEFFQGLLHIHPFSDGNGRVARSLLMQQCVEEFGHVDMSRFDRGVEYYAALQAADEKNFEPLKTLIDRAVTQ